MSDSLDPIARKIVISFVNTHPNIQVLYGFPGLGTLRNFAQCHDMFKAKISQIRPFKNKPVYSFIPACAHLHKHFKLTLPVKITP